MTVISAACCSETRRRIAGTDSFEEVVDVGQLTALRDPLREKLVELAKGHGIDVP